MNSKLNLCLDIVIKKWQPNCDNVKHLISAQHVCREPLLKGFPRDNSIQEPAPTLTI